MAFANRIKAKTDNSLYNVYLPVEGTDEFPLSDGKFKKGGTSCVSIDIAIKNFAIRREVWHSHKDVKPELFHKINFAGEKESGTASINPDVLVSANDFLNEIFEEHIKTANIILIERQLAVSPKNRSMFDLVLNFIISRRKYLKEDVILMDINPKAKSKILRPKVRMTSNELKKWCIDEAMKILEKRNDEWSIKWLQHHKGTSKTKADDLADTVIQMEALYQLINK